MFLEVEKIFGSHDELGAIQAGTAFTSCMCRHRQQAHSAGQHGTGKWACAAVGMGGRHTRLASVGMGSGHAQLAAVGMGSGHAQPAGARGASAGQLTGILR